MSKITDIRARQVIDCSGEELGKVINAALGADFTLNYGGSFELEPWGSGLTVTGEAFRAFFTGRRFANLESVTACVMDCQLEQIDVISAERNELLDCLEQVVCCWGDIDPKHAGDVRARALAAIAKANGEA